MDFQKMFEVFDDLTTFILRGGALVERCEPDVVDTDLGDRCDRA